MSTHVTDNDGGESDLKMAEAIGKAKRAWREGDGDALEDVGFWFVSKGRQLREGGDE